MSNLRSWDNQLLIIVFLCIVIQMVSNVTNSQNLNNLNCRLLILYPIDSWFKLRTFCSTLESWRVKCSGFVLMKEKLKLARFCIEFQFSVSVSDCDVVIREYKHFNNSIASCLYFMTASRTYLLTDSTFIVDNFKMNF